MEANGHIIGIDLGTTNSVVAVIEAGEPVVIANAEGQPKTPSVVAFLEDGQVMVGEIARRQAATMPRRTISSVKRLIGRLTADIEDDQELFPFELAENGDGRVLIKVEDRNMLPEEVSALVLQKLKTAAEDYLGEPVSRAIVTVPAYFDDNQRQATLEAAKLAGLEVLRLLNEPTAAAMAYGLGRDAHHIVAVYDFGGGTFDFCMLEIDGKTFEVLVSNGDSRLGGDDLDSLLIDHLADQFEKAHGVDLRQDLMALRRLKDAAERAKCELSSAFETLVSLPFIAYVDGAPLHLETSISREFFEELAEPLVRETLDCCANGLRQAKLRKNDITKVILVGGSTRIPLVQDMVEDFFGLAPFKGLNPDEIVAVGAATQGAVMNGALEEVILLDVTPHCLGIEIKGNRKSTVIEKNSTIPLKVEKSFTTTEENQSFVNIHVLQGDSARASECRSVGKFTLSGIEDARAGNPRIRVTFFINADGIVEISATDVQSGAARTLTINHAHLSADERRSQQTGDNRRKRRRRRLLANETRNGFAATNPTAHDGTDAQRRIASQPSARPDRRRAGSAGSAEVAEVVDAGPALEKDATADPMRQRLSATFAEVKGETDPPRRRASAQATPAPSTPPRRAPAPAPAPPEPDEFEPEPEPAAPVRSAAAARPAPVAQPAAVQPAPAAPAPPARRQEPAPVRTRSTDNHPAVAQAKAAPPERPANLYHSEDSELDLRRAENAETDVRWPTHADRAPAPVAAPVAAPLAAPVAAPVATMEPPPETPRPGLSCPVPPDLGALLEQLEGGRCDAETCEDYAAQGEKFLQFCQDNTDELALQLLLARFYIYTKQAEEAREVLERIRARRPDLSDALIDIYSQLCQFFPNYNAARKDRAALAMTAGDYTTAITDLEFVARREEGSEEVFDQLNQLYELQLATHPDPTLQFKLVKLHLRRQEIDAAISLLQHLVGNPEFHARANKVLGLCFWQKSMRYLAWQKFRELPLDDEMKDILYRLADDMERHDELLHAKYALERINEAAKGYKDIGERLKKLAYRLDLQRDERYGGLNQRPGSPEANGEFGERFDVIEEINRGSMGIVYKARDRILDEIVAIKVLNDFLCADPAAVERFKQEARSARKLTHINVVRIHDMFDLDDKKIISMEYIEGENLKTLLARAMTFTEEIVLTYLMQVCEGLAYAHRLKVVHRDIKPANIMITDRNLVKITDFGIAKVLNEKQTKAGTVIMGTPLYMAPEQIEGSRIDHRCDIYALGIMLYEMVTGNPPFTDGNIEYKHIHHPAPEIRVGVGDRLRQIIMKCIAKRPEDRFQSVEEILARIV